MAYRSPRSLVWKLGLPFVIFEIITGGIVAVMVGARVSETLLNQSDLRLEAALLSAGREISHDGAAGSSMAMVGVGDLRVTVISEKGRVLQDTRSATASMDSNLLFRPEIETAVRGGVGKVDRYSRSAGRVMRYWADLVADPAGNTVIVRVGLPLDEITQAAVWPMLIVGMDTTALVVVTCLLLWLIRRGLRRETRTLASLARGIGDGSTGREAIEVARKAPAELTRLAARLVRSGLSVRSQLKAIEASQSETLGILASMSNGVIALDNEHRIITMNPAATRMFGVLGRDIRGRLLEEVVRDPSFLQAISEGVDEGRMLFKELELESLGGRTMEVAIEPLFGGRLLQMTGVLIVLNETTRLRRLERIRSDFAANVSHELRTPLTAVRGYIELLEQNVTDEEGVKRLKIIDRNAARLGAIIEDLLTLSRLESDDESSMPLDFEPLDAEDLLNGVAAVCLEQAQRGGVEVRVESERTQFEGNRHLLDQALVNLVENAIRYGGDGSVVTLRGRATNVNEVELAVSDTGPGIAPEHLSRLFERFYRVDSGRSREQGGTGLGLSIVKHIALVHGGQVGVESQVGSSSTFFIRLPVAGPAR